MLCSSFRAGTITVSFKGLSRLEGLDGLDWLNEPDRLDELRFDELNELDGNCGSKTGISLHQLS